MSISQPLENRNRVVKTVSLTIEIRAMLHRILTRKEHSSLGDIVHEVTVNIDETIVIDK